MGSIKKPLESCYQCFTNSLLPSNQPYIKLSNNLLKNKEIKSKTATVICKK